MIENTQDKVELKPGDTVDMMGPDTISHAIDDVMAGIATRMDTEGAPAIATHVFGGMVAMYLRGLKAIGREVCDQDALAIQQLLALARSAAEPVPVFAHYRDAAEFAIKRVAILRPTKPGDKSGEELAHEFVKWHGAQSIDDRKLEGAEFPDYWTMADAKRYIEFKRKREAEIRKHAEAQRQDQVKKTGEALRGLFARSTMAQVFPSQPPMDAAQEGVNAAMAENVPGDDMAAWRAEIGEV